MREFDAHAQRWYKSDYQGAPQWRNWQTRYVQGVVSLRSCGFKSLLRHQDNWSFLTRSSSFVLMTSTLVFLIFSQRCVLASNVSNPSTSPQRRSVRPMLVVLIMLCLIFVISYAARLGERQRMEDEIIAQETAIANAIVRQAQLKAELERVSSPAYVDEVARTVFQLGKEGETTFKGVLLSNSSPDPVLNTQPQLYRDPVWRQWLELILPGE